MDLRKKISAFPPDPGIYFFKNARGGVIYIGKARRLRDRVRSYFQPSDDPKVAAILAETADVEYVLTASEREAAFLENSFVQQSQPKFNLRLKDDKSFPYLRVTAGDPVPGIYFSRRVGPGPTRFFGPFNPAHEARQTIRLVGKAFGLRTCEPAVFRKRKRTCLEYDLKQCAGPCVGLITEAEYRRNVEDALLFLEGKTERLAEDLGKRMRLAAGRQAFEEAARWRDVLKTVEQVRIKPALVSVRLEDQDVFGYASGGGLHAVHVFVMRKGKTVRARAIVRDEPPDRPREEVLAEVLSAFYAQADPPPRLLVPFPPAGGKRLAAEFSARTGRKVAILAAPRGRARAILEMSARNAERALAERDEALGSLLELKAALGLETFPVRIEGFDVSNTQGTETVASMVSFENGRPWKDGYRKFRIRTVEGPNDVAALSEVLKRHYGRAVEERKSLPDLVLVDGGKPQLHAARRVLAELGLGNLPLASLAKREETVFSAGRKSGLRMARTSAALKLLQHIRDEAHRFAISFHRQRRARRSLQG